MVNKEFNFMFLNIILLNLLESIILVSGIYLVYDGITAINHKIDHKLLILAINIGLLMIFHIINNIILFISSNSM